MPLDYNVGPNTVEAYIFTGNSLPDKLDINSQTLSKVSLQEWITTDYNSNTLNIQTSNSASVGNYTVVLV